MYGPIADKNRSKPILHAVHFLPTTSRVWNLRESYAVLPPIDVARMARLCTRDSAVLCIALRRASRS